MFFECVAGLLRDKFKEYLNSVLSRLKRLGYKMHVFKVDAYDYGVPQHCHRALIIGFRCANRFDHPPKTRGGSIREATASLGPPNGYNRHVMGLSGAGVHGADAADAAYLGCARGGVEVEVLLLHFSRGAPLAEL